MPASDAGGPGRRTRLAGLYVIVGGADPVAQADAALAGGARALQVRMKAAPAGAVLDVARRVVALAAGRALVIVNDRADLALLAGADGVHLGDDDLPVAEARRLVGPELLVGRTSRTLAEARAAIAAGADHVGFGPVFASRTKVLPVGPRGLTALREVAAGLGAPVVAIGGIGLSNVAAVARHGACAAAVISDVLGATDPAGRARAVVLAFRQAREEDA